jgi:hypothetical protein
MSSPEDVSLESVRRQLQEKLRRVNDQLRKEMLARGFDPAQDENLALTAPLAELYMQREELRAELDRLSGVEDFTGERDESCPK